MMVASVFRAIFDFASPLAIYQLLRYVETGGEGQLIKPWSETIAHHVVASFNPAFEQVLGRNAVFQGTF